MIIQNCDGSIAREPGHRRLNRHTRQDYYATIPAHLLDEHSSLIDWIIGFAFETLGVSRLEVRVYDETDALVHCEAGCSPARPAVEEPTQTDEAMHRGNNPPSHPRSI